MSVSSSPGVGDLLKNRRLHLGLSLDAFAARTRIRLGYLRALEDERFEAFPGEAYLSGFLRLYAEALELDTEEMLAVYRRQTAPPDPIEVARAEDPSPPAAPPASRRSRGRLLLVGLCALAVVGSLLLLQRFSAPPLAAPTTTAESSPVHLPLPAQAVPVPAKTPPAPVRPAASRTPIAVPTKAPSSSVAARQVIVVPAGGSTLRLTAFARGTVQVAIDRFPPRRYVLSAGTDLRWRVRHRARLQLADHAGVRLWLGAEKLPLSPATKEIDLVPGEATQQGRDQEAK